MCKPFLTIDEQIDLLEKRRMTTNDATPGILKREGYYSIVNGYKGPFIDVDATKAADDDRYIVGTTFNDLYQLFSFDRSLRIMTFSRLIKAEATAKTAIAYCFADAHRGHDDYLLQSNYCTQQEFVDYGKKAEDYADEISGLTLVLRKRKEKSSAEFIEHYRNEYGVVPIWVLCNDLTFGNIEHFFNLMKPVEKEAVCRMIAESTGKLGSKILGYFDVDTARVSLEALVKFRNICAHDERLYCAHVGDRKHIGYDKIIWMLERYLTDQEFYEFLRELTKLVGGYLKENKTGYHLLSSLGFPEMIQKIDERVRIIESTGQPH